MDRRLPRIEKTSHIAPTSRPASQPAYLSTMGANSASRRRLVLGLSLLLVPGGIGLALAAGPPLTTSNATGTLQTTSTTGAVASSGAFFQSLGTNDRACVTCHRPEESWSITPGGILARFNRTNGLDPLFRAVDGANAPNLSLTTLDARRRAYSMLLSKGVLRVGLPIPAGAEFTLAAAEDPYRFASARELSLFRRPLPSTNLRFLSTVMWDGREGQTMTREALRDRLRAQAANATTGHAQASGAPPTGQLDEMVNFELALHTAQATDTQAGPLNALGAAGGVSRVEQQPYSPGINTPGTPGFNPQVFTLFGAWEATGGGPVLPPSGGGRGGRPGPPTRPDPGAAARQSVARGERLFNSRQFTVTGVAGLNDSPATASLRVTCSGCHNTPNVGSFSQPRLFNLGLADGVRRTPDMPLYTLRNNATGQTVRTTDPGQGLVTGRWADVGKFKVPALRGLSARAPFFHNGSAPSTDAVVTFYETRFRIGLSQQERADLSAFLRCL